METLPVFIPCYFGTQSVREKRIAAFEKQVEWFLGLDKRIHLYIDLIDPNYYNYYHPLLDHERVAYRLETHLKHSSFFKNRFLRDFYEKVPPFHNAKWCVLADNDSILYDHFMGGSIFSHMLDYPFEWEKLDMWYPINPINEPFNWRYKDNLVNQLIHFERAGITLKGSLIALRNHGRKIFFNEKRTCSEDTEFLINMIIKGMLCYKCVSTVLKEIVPSQTQSTFNSLKNPEDRKVIVAQDKIQLAENYPPLQSKINDNGNVSFITKRFYEKYRVGQKRIRIPVDPNDNPIIFKELF